MAFRAAEAVRCAGDQGKYWEMRDQLLANIRTLDKASDHAQAVGLDMTRFNLCYAGGTFADAIRRDMAQAQSAGIEGTPSFLLATQDANGQVKVKKVIRGAAPYANFKTEIDLALAAR
jgi:protein-disulfide isomerase